MNHKERLLSLLQGSEIRSIPKAARLEYARDVYSRSESWCGIYLNERIEPLLRFVEPLCVEESGIYHHQFAVRCQFRGDMSEFELALMHHHAADDAEKSDSDELYDHVQAWVSPDTVDDCTEEDVVGCRLSMATVLRYMNRSSSAVGLWEYWLGLELDDYRLDCAEPDKRLIRKLAATDLYQHTENVQICVITSLARALSFADGREDEPAVTLIESWLGFFPSAYKSRVACELMLEQTRLPKVNSPHDEAELLATLGQSICCVNETVRSKAGAVNVLKAWAGIPEDAYSFPTSDRMISAMPNSRFGQIGNPPAESEFVGILGDALRVARSTQSVGSASSKQEEPIMADGPQQALNLMEGWLGFSQELYDEERYNELLTAIAASPLPLSGSADKQANFVMRFAETLRLSHKRGPGHAARFILAWLRVPKEVVDDPNEQIGERVLSCPLILEISSDQIRINLICLMANVLRQVDAIGARQSAKILLTYAGIASSVLDDQELESSELIQHIGVAKNLQEIDRRSFVYFVETLAKCLKSLPSEMFRHAIHLLCSLLQFEPSAIHSRNHATVEASFEGCGIGEDQQAVILLQLADALKFDGKAGAKAAAFILSVWTGLSEDNFSSGTSSSLRAYENSRISRIPSASACGIVSQLATAWLEVILGGDKSGASLLLASISLAPDAFSVAEASAIPELIVDSAEFGRFGNRTNQATFMKTLCECLAAHGEAERALVLNLLEYWCGGSVATILSAAMLQSATLNTRLRLAQVGLTCLEESSEKAFQAADAIVEFVAQTSGESIHFEWRRDFIERIRSIWSDIKDVGLARSEFLVMGNCVSDEVDQKLLGWAEVFENRLLVDEYRLTETVFNDASDFNVSTLTPGTSALRGDWSEERLNARRRDWNTAAQIQAGQISACIHVEAATQSRKSDRQLVRRSREQIERLSTLDDKEFRLVDSVPENSVWIRSIFDSRGRLYTWAYERQSGRLSEIGRVASRDGSLLRLSVSNLIADAQIELIWQRCNNSQRPPGEQVYMPFQIEESLFDLILTSLSKQSLPDSHLVQEQNEKCEELESNGTVLRHFPNLLSLTSALLSKKLNKALQSDSDLMALVTNGLRALSEIANDCPQCWETWRMTSLDRTSERQLAVSENELELENLLAECDDSKLRKMDVIFQVEGPLLAVPLSWISFRSNPFFASVLSTSVSISARFRAISQPTVVSSEGTFDLVTATWESPETRSRGATGIAILEDDIRQHLLKNHPETWRHWGLGDSPIASHSNLSQLTLALKQTLRMLLICAHGDESRLGVKLADEKPWLGKGIKVENCDFVVLASCAMGRLLQDSGRDVEGFLAGLFSQGARSVLAAKWRIADMETAHFLYAVITAYLNEIGSSPDEQFLRARVLNTVLKEKLQSIDGGQSSNFTKHLAMAFDIYGAG